MYLLISDTCFCKEIQTSPSFIVYSHEAALRLCTIVLKNGVPVFYHQHVHHSGFGISSQNIYRDTAQQV